MYTIFINIYTIYIYIYIYISIYVSKISTLNRFVSYISLITCINQGLMIELWNNG